MTQATRKPGAAWKAPVLLALLAAGAAGAWYAGAAAVRCSPAWLVRGLTSAASLRCLSILLLGVALLTILGRALWRAGAAARAARRTGGQSGNVLIEFALVLPLLLGIVLVMLQSALVMTGSVCVHYAAYAAARAAIVQVPDGPRDPDTTHALPYDAQDTFGDMLEGNQPNSPKGQRIDSAAVLALLPVAGNSRHGEAADATPLTDAATAFYAAPDRKPGLPWRTGLLENKLWYARKYTKVSVVGSTKDVGGKSVYAADTDLTVTVEHALYLSVPYAGRLFAQFRDGLELDLAPGEYATLVRATCVLTNEGVQDYVEEEPYKGR